MPPEETGKIEESTLRRVFDKYLMKVCPLGLCIAIRNVIYKNNVILRESTDVLVELSVEILCIQLKEGEYFEGTVTEMSSEGIKISFMGVLEGTVRANLMHQNTHYDMQNNSWLFLQNP